MTEWKNLSEERQKEYLGLLSAYESMLERRRRLKTWWIVTGVASFGTGLVTGLLISGR